MALRETPHVAHAVLLPAPQDASRLPFADCVRGIRYTYHRKRVDLLSGATRLLLPSLDPVHARVHRVLLRVQLLSALRLHLCLVREAISTPHVEQLGIPQSASREVLDALRRDRQPMGHAARYVSNLQRWVVEGLLVACATTLRDVHHTQNQLTSSDIRKVNWYRSVLILKLEDHRRHI